MTEDDRNEVTIETQRIDTASGYIIEKKNITLKSKSVSIDNLIKKAGKI